jgi:hypothetical protein
MSNDFKALCTAAVMGIATMTLGSAFAQDQGKPASSGMPSASPMGTHHMKQAQDGTAAVDPMALKKAQMAAQQAQSKLNGPPPDALELARAARSKNVEVAKRILVRNGFTPQQLEGADIVLDDKTGGGALTPESRLSITIEASCCPLKIVITIRL